MAPANGIEQDSAETGLIIAEIFNSNPIIFLLMVGIIGLLVGSFLNVVIYRVPVMMEREERIWHQAYAAQDNETEVNNARSRTHTDSAGKEAFNLMRPGSACPECGAPIKPVHNVPILSYLALRGRCANCSAPISIRYPIIESLTGMLSLLVAWQFGFSIACVGGLILTWTLIALTVIDFDRQWLPDRMTLPLLWMGLGFSLLSSADGSAVFSDTRSSVIGAMAGYLSLWAVYQGFRLITGKEGMGYGDFKLLAALGAWLGWKMLPIIILLSAGVGLVAAVAMMIFRGHNRQVPIPFGPYLAIAGFIVLLRGPELFSAWLGSGIPAGVGQ